MTSLVHIAGVNTTPAPDYHLVPGDPPLLFLTAGSQVFAVDEEFAADLKNSVPASLGILESLQAHHTRISRNDLPEQPLAISLNIAQSCNLTCSYCYADKGRFGGKSRMMMVETALTAIDRLLNGSGTRPVSIGFIGGEPLLNRRVLHAAVNYAAHRSGQTGLKVSFGITTNGTLIEPEDIALFRKHRFAVTVSLDGGREINDGLRLTKNSGSSFDEVVKRIRPLLLEPGRARVAARATVSRNNLDISGRLAALAEAGFSEAGVSPLRSSPVPSLALTGADWSAYLAAMQDAGAREWRRVKQGGGFFFSNLAIVLKQLHRGDYRTLPCGAAGNYASVSASGDYFTCHRTVDDPRFFLGGSDTGPLYDARKNFIDSRQVDQQQPCNSCWARYLCGGGCHAEVLQSGRSGCDYIRGWLEYCITLYPEVLRTRPDLMGGHS